MSKHTPGPWHAKPETDHWRASVWDAVNYQVCEVYGEDKVTRTATARLISAAPDLLLALKNQLEWGVPGAITPAWEQLQKASLLAIAKAETKE